MRVTVDLPDKVWAQLATRADKAGLKVGDILGEALREIVTPTVERPRRSRVTGPRHRFTPEDTREITRLFSAGVPYTAIAEMFGVRRQTIHMKLTRLGLIEGKK